MVTSRRGHYPCRRTGGDRTRLADASLQRRYLDYQVNIGNRMIALLTSGSETAREEAAAAAKAKTHFLDLVDELFAETGKRALTAKAIDCAFQYEGCFRPTCFLREEKNKCSSFSSPRSQDHNPMCSSWTNQRCRCTSIGQKHLISMVRTLNPNVQIPFTTHSPAVIMDGWEDCVTEVSGLHF